LRTSPLIRRARGFTLIEVVVAFVLLSLVLVTGFEIFAKGMARAGDLEDRSRALGIAQSKLSAVGTEELFKVGETRGESDDRRFRWAQVVTQSDEGQDPVNPAEGPFVLYRVDVRVEWQASSGRDQSVALATMALGQRQQ
jgi:general secretion pathway protein I